jgi:hypothetical protein
MTDGTRLRAAFERFKKAVAEIAAVSQGRRRTSRGQAPQEGQESNLEAARQESSDLDVIPRLT